MTIIRTATQKDINNILKLYTPYILNTVVTFEYEVPSAQSFAARFESVVQQFCWLVCEIDGELAGYAYASKAFERAAYQWNADISVYISDKFQRRSIATAFYKAIEQFLRMQGYRNVYAIVTGENQNSINFHKALGYSSFAVFNKAGCKFGRWLDVIWFVKQLNAFKPNPTSPVSFSSLDKKTVDSIMLECCKIIK